MVHSRELFGLKTADRIRSLFDSSCADQRSKANQSQRSHFQGQSELHASLINRSSLNYRFYFVQILLLQKTHFRIVVVIQIP